MSNKIIRQWYQLGPVVILIDYALCTPVAYINTRIREQTYTQWTPDQESMLYEFAGHAVGSEKGFVFNPHSREEVETALTQAMSWCEAEVGQPYKRLSKLEFLVKLLIFWKYEPVKVGNRTLAIRPRGSGLEFNEKYL